jgi:hypothetical protein
MLTDEAQVTLLLRGNLFHVVKRFSDRVTLFGGASKFFFPLGPVSVLSRPEGRNTAELATLVQALPPGCNNGPLSVVEPGHSTGHNM